MKNFTELAEMSKLTFTPEQETKIRADLEQMIKFVSPVENAKISNTIDSSPILNLSELRDDTPRPSLTINQTHLNTKHRKDRFFVVPQVVE